MTGSKVFALVMIVTIGMMDAVSKCYGDEQWVDLTKPPSMKPSKARFKTTQAVIELPIAIDLQQIKVQAEAKLPQLLHTIDERRTGPCVDLYVAKKCLTVDLAGWVKRNGALSIDGQGNQLLIKLPLKSRITASGTGDLAQLSQTGQGAITIDIKVAIAIAANWQPQITVTTDYQWDVPFYVELAGVKISLRKQADKAIAEQMDKVKQQLMAQLQQQINLREIAQKAWSQAQQPVMVDEQNQLWFDIAPKQAFLRYVGIKQSKQDSSRKQFVVDGAVLLDLQAQIGQFPQYKAKDIPLPKLSFAAEDSGFTLRTPLIVSYEQISQQLMSQLNQQDALTVRYQQQPISVNHIYVYPHRSLLIFAVKLNLAENPFGIVYLRAKPVIDRKNRQVILKGLAFSGANEHVFWSQQNQESSQQLLSQIKQQAKFNYAELLSQVEKMAKQDPWHQLNPQISISGQLGKVNLHKLVPLAEGLMVDIGAKGEVSARFDLAAQFE